MEINCDAEDTIAKNGSIATYWNGWANELENII